MPSAESDELTTGRSLGHYRILDRLGAGGMGEVYLAQDTRLERRVAIKILPAELARSPERMSRFIREAKAASALNHPHIAHIYEIGESDAGVNFIAMEYVEGVTFREKLHRDRAPLRELLKYLVQVAEGLAKAHSAGIIHRDLKPDNIVVSKDGYAKVLDFGLAKHVEAEQFPSGSDDNDPASEAKTVVMERQLSTPGTIMGTAGYMSPEQARGASQVDQRSDIFAFGCLVYEAATGGRQAFPGETAVDSLYKILHSQPPPIRDSNPSAPPDLQRVVRRCLQKDPEDRYQTIKDVAIELRDLREEMRDAGGPLPLASDAPDKGRPTVADMGTWSAGGPATVPSDPAVNTASGTGEHRPPERVRMTKGVAAIVILAVLVSVGGIGHGIYRYFAGFDNAPGGDPAFKLTPLTSSPTVERNPALSPEGKQVAFAWTGEKGDNFDIYVKITDAGTPLRLTSGPAKEMSPSWSPDGRFVAFLRADGTEKGVYTIPALGGVERKVSDAFGWPSSGVRGQALDWSPDGKSIAVVDKTTEAEPWSVFLINVDTGERRRLTTPPPDHDGDTIAAFSPDGHSVAFLRRRDAGTSDIYTVPVEGGEPAQVTHDGVAIRGVEWTGSGERIVFSSERGGGTSTLWTIAADGGQPSPVAGTGENLSELSVAGNRLVYAQLSTDINLWRMENPFVPGARRDAQDVPSKFSISNRSEIDPHYSPNGDKVVFSSNRSGGSEIWICGSDGGNPVQVTNFGSSAVTGSPQWSPDGRLIAFDSRAGGNSDIYVVSPEGGSPRRLTMDESEDVVPSWSADGKFIYFASRRAGRLDLWKVSAGGGDAVRVTTDGGFISAEARDGSGTLFFTKSGAGNGIWSVSPGADETKVLDLNVGRSWAVSRRGIYLLNAPATDGEPYTLQFYDLSTKQTGRPVPIQGTSRSLPINVLAVSPDDRWLVYAERDLLDYDLMLVENFR